MNVFVNRREGDCGDTLLDPYVDLFRAGVARHRLHDLVENLALVGSREPVIRTKFTEGPGLDAGKGLHQELVNDNYSRSSSGDAGYQCNRNGRLVKRPRTPDPPRTSIYPTVDVVRAAVAPLLVGIRYSVQDLPLGSASMLRIDERLQKDVVHVA
jgi:hypothetical protein